MTQAAPLTFRAIAPRRHRRSLNYLIGPVAALFFAACGIFLAFGNPGTPFGQGLVVTCMVVPAVYLAVGRSTQLLPYVLTLYMIAPEVRRVLDWSGGTYTSVTVISLVPMMATLAMGLPAWAGRRRIPRQVRLPLALLTAACAYASAVGVVLNGAAAVPEAMGWTVPLVVLAYLASRPPDPAEREGWLWAFSAIAVGVSIYTWVQFVTAPNWDMMWLVYSGMTSSMGQPRPLEFRAFGPLNSTGAAGFYFPFVIAAVWTARPLRNGFGAITALLAASALLITQVRSGWLMAAAMVLAGMIVRGGGSRFRQLLGLVVTAGILFAVLPFLPGGDRVQDRFQTFEDLQNDGSTQARAETTQSLLGQVAADPFGSGLGAGSEAKVSGASAGVAGIDNGFVAILVYFGWAGATLFFAGIFMLGRLALTRGTSNPVVRGRPGLDVEYRPLAVATLLGMLVGTIAFTAFSGVSAFVGWLLYGMMLLPAAAVPATPKQRPARSGVGRLGKPADVEPILATAAKPATPEADGPGGLPDSATTMQRPATS